MATRILGMFVVCILIFSGGQILEAQDPSSQIEEIKKKSEDINRKIEKRKAKIQKFSHKESNIIDRLNQSDRLLNQSRKRVSALERNISSIEEKISETTRSSENLMRQIKVNEEYVASRLVALYKLKWLGTVHVLTSAENLHELLQRKTAIERILTYDQQVIAELMVDRMNLETMQSRLVTQRDAKHRQASEHKKQIKQMAIERRKRAHLLASVRKEKSAQLAAIESLKQAATDLNAKMKKLSARSIEGTPNEYTVSRPFRAYKGLLKMPVKGKIVSLFGKFKNTQYQVLNFRSGIEIQTERGEPIQAVYAGKILYADWFKGYGNMIIIDHGESFYTVYAHIEEIFKAAGDVVETGEVMATVGDTGSITGSKLYFEVRHHGKPLDPMQWLERS